MAKPLKDVRSLLTNTNLPVRRFCEGIVEVRMIVSIVVSSSVVPVFHILVFVYITVADFSNPSGKKIRILAAICNYEIRIMSWAPT